MRITFLPSMKEIDADSDDNLLHIACKAGILINASCAGTGKCGKCKIKIISGTVNPLSENETALLSEFEIANGYRLACCTQVQSDLEVMIPDLHGGSTRKKNMAQLPDDFVPENRIVSSYRKVPKATMKYQLNDLARISESYEKPQIQPAYGLLPHIHQILDESRGNVTATFYNQLLLSLESGDSSQECYGAAFDIGTTTVVGMLWHLHSHQLIDVEAKTNYQSTYGSDVISRIQFCNESPEHVSLMQAKVIQCCNDILEDIYIRNHILPGHVHDVTIVGNTTMSHLVFGVPPKSMSRTPFAPVFCTAQNMQAKDLNIQVNPLANVFLLPNIAGHVGSDIVGMMLAVRMDTLTGCHIAIDIGTNGEVVAIKDGHMLTCSTAAGPAFEGSSIRHGMRASAGAIERVTITKQDVQLKTISDLPPVGICGSGLIDAVAQLLNSGIVDTTGRMLTRQEALEKGISLSLAERIINSNGQGLAFILASGEEGDNIVLTQQDIREVQLAKGAILAGIQTLMHTLQINISDIDSIMLAGAFGNYINKESALRIGLLPKVPISRILSVGNAAGAGASMALLSDEERRHASSLALNTEHIELSMNMDFQNYYMTAMSFQI